MSGAEHPLIAAHRAHAAANLVGKGLKAQRAIARGKGARDGGARALGSLGREENVNRLLEAPLQEIRIAVEWNQRTRPPSRA